MCATVIWAVNAAAFTPELKQFTRARLGVTPQETDYRIVADEVRPSSVPFSLTVNTCDCGGLIGQGTDGDPGAGELTATQLLSWLQDLPANVPHVSTVAVAREWSPSTNDFNPARARRAMIDAIDEAALRDVVDDSLLVIDYPRTG